MAESEIEICNSALSMLSDATIANFSENTTSAKLCKNLWAISRDAVLRLHPWNCAVKRVKLPPNKEAPVDVYFYAFTMPPDLLRLLSIYNLKDFKIEGRDILANVNDISIRYVFRNKDVNTYDALLVEVLAAYMSYKLAYPITRSTTVREEMWNMFKNILPVSKSVDAQEEPADSIDDFPFISVRG